METLTVTIHCENGAFADDADAEIARILHKLATHFADGPLGATGRLLDITGRHCGDWSFRVHEHDEPEITDEDTLEPLLRTERNFKLIVTDKDYDHEVDRIIGLRHHDTRSEQEGER